MGLKWLLDSDALGSGMTARPKTHGSDMVVKAKHLSQK